MAPLGLNTVRRRPTSLRWRLTALTLALFVGLVTIAIALLLTVRTLQRRATEKQLVATARALSLAVDGRVLVGQALLDALATSDSLARADYPAFAHRARALGAGPDSWFVLYDLNGHARINTNAALPPPPQGSAPISPQLRRRLDDAVVHGGGVTGLFFGRRAKEPLIALDRLVRTRAGERLMLTMALSPRVIERVFAAQRLPDGWTGSLVDARQLIIARNDGTDRFVGRPVTAPAARAMARARESVVDSVSQAGRPTVLAFTRSALTGWSLLVGLPQGEAALPLDGWLTLLSLLFLALLSVGALAVVVTVRGVDRSLGSLNEVAARVGRGETVGAAATGLADTDAVARVLQDASLRLRTRETELREAAAALEARVRDRTAELEATHLQLAHAQKLEAIGRLTGGVAHDFNNLLTGVIGNLELLQRRLGDDPLARFVVNAHQAADRGAKLTRQLLAFARRQRLEPRTVDLAREVEDIRPLLVSALGSGTRLSIDATAAVGLASVDPVQLELAVLNLVINARDAMDGAGEVVVSLAQALVCDPAARDEEPEPGRYVVVCVADAGAGMTPELRDRALEPFFTTKAAGLGSGLGLSQVVGFAKQSGGGVRIDSEPGRGTTVRIFLPLAAEQASTGADVEPPPPPRRLEGRSVLVIDDDAAVRGVAGAMLTDAGCRVALAASGEEGLALLRGGDVAPDVLLTDFAMPGMNGGEVAARVRQIDPRLPIVIMTGFMDPSKHLGGWSGAVLSKPFEAAALTRALDDALAA